jgi:hypothetical protein
MARIVSIFQFTGRAGSAVGSKGKGGKVLLRQYQPSVANPRTAAQMGQRAKIKLASQVAGMLGAVGRTALVANGKSKNARGTLVKQLLQNVRVSADGTKASLGYDLNLVGNPSYKRSLIVAVTAESTAYVATFTGANEGDVIAKAILVHDLATGNWRHTSAMDTDTSLSIGKSANENGDALEVFAYGIVLMPKTNEGFNNVGQTGANPTGYVIDLDKLSTTNYDFSPCLSAALNVSGNSGSGNPTSGGNSGNSGSGNSGSGSETPNVTAPVISGTSPFADTTQVTLTEPEGARAYYTTDGSTPTAESTLYTEPFTLSATTTVKAVAIKDGVSSSVASKTFTKSSGDNGGTTE